MEQINLDTANNFIDSLITEINDGAKEIGELKQMLSEISSQLKDWGGFEILTGAIDNKIK